MTRPPSFREARLPLFLPADPPDDDGAALDQLLPGRLPSYVRDHRKRLRTRFMEGGAAAMPEYELLELILFRAIPRHDVKPLARLLLPRDSALRGLVELRVAAGGRPSLGLPVGATAELAVGGAWLR
jgi:hypothetical protein